MQLSDGQVIVSATDLVGFLACDHLTTLELGRIEDLWERPHQREDPDVVLLQERGEAHEQAYLERLRREGRSVVEIARPEPRTPTGYRAAEAATLQAMRDGVGAIYQATLFDGRWLGFADFLLRVGGDSDLGNWHYEVADTKLARSVKGGALLQVCVYSERLAELQGRQPALVHVVTGDSATHSLRLDDYAAYYRRVRARFEHEVFGDTRGPARDPRTVGTYPDPVEHCRVCAWFPVCMDRREADDHLSLVAGMTRAATATLTAAGVTTLAALGGLEPAASVPELNARTLERLREQARMQLAGRLAGRTASDPLWELIPPRPDERWRGLAILPDPSPLDVFFDIEADPWLDDHGREYLLGVLWRNGGEAMYEPIWGHTANQEKEAFERFVDTVIDRLEVDPGMHVYHYGGYESGAIKRLMQRYATREDEVDRILRAGVLVDLYTVVRQGIRASVDSYSLKRVEHLFGFDRDGRVTEAGFSVVTYETWLRDADPVHLADLAAYNRDDCLATLGLHDWLEARRAEALALGWDLQRPEPEAGEPPETLATEQARTAERVAALRQGVPNDPEQRTAAEQARWLLAGLLDYHRREAKPEWWRWYDLKNKETVEDLIGDPDAIGGLVYEGDVETRRTSVVRRYRFPPQDHRFRPGGSPTDPDGRGGLGEDAGTITAIDDAAGWIDLLRGPSKLATHPRALIPAVPRGIGVLRDGLGRLADDVIGRGLGTEVEGHYRAARDLLLRRPPRVVGLHPGSPVRPAGEPILDTARRLVTGLDGTVLAVQGPPGTGKTWTGARMVLAALEAGRGPVGVTAQSHKTIGNALKAIAEAAREDGRSIRIVQKCGPDEASGVAGVTVVGENRHVDAALEDGTVDVVAGTAWLFAREAIQDRLGLLVADESGQLALATVLAMSGAARSIVLLGDPNQLAQVTQGLHPEGADASALEHLLDGAATIPPDRGLFLDRTWRMHPDVNGYVSETFYEGRLATDPTTARQRIDATGIAGGTGIRWLPVDHRRNEQHSREEAGAVAEVVAGAIGQPWIDIDGNARPLTYSDLLVVAPYNAQVAEVQRAIEDRLGPVSHDRVGTVDKFQGREGALAIYTMAASSAEDAPRGMDFLYDMHRLNVAVSRARAVAIVVASPGLLTVAARTPEQMRLANALCRLVEVADDQRRGLGSGTAQPGPAEPLDLTLGL